MQSDSTILLVEDDIDVRESMLEVLTDEGFRVVGATDGLDAIARLQSASSLPALILLDLMMPRMNGEQFRAQLLKVPQWSSIPVVLVSADAHLAKKAASLAVAGYLEKPVRLEELFQTIERFTPRGASG